MQTLVGDTHSIIKKLESKGFSRSQAEGISSVLHELDASALVTKSDLKLALGEQTISLLKWMTGILFGQAALIVSLVELFN